ncbi:Uncharcterized protein, DUF927 family [Caballeronia arationis]|uniref:Uncharcterized protein, DUF927 family n=1 Tax=Caballeronia arationis TaxID=1777142 RepID=A0A7Z7N3R5_9BURK|nr:DUF927 domain-containing protein [Caballeronia arationis]SOE81040.1 Uncharcterized protein, DUF927 family [Caballeronia arationis]
MLSNDLYPPVIAHPDRATVVTNSCLVTDMNELNRRALAQCGNVVKWLGISGKHDGIHFDGRLILQDSGDAGPFMLEKIGGRWECVNHDQPFGRDFISLVAFVLRVGDSEAANELEQFLDVLDSGTDLESISDVGLSAVPVTAPIIPVPSNVRLPETFGWLGDTATEYPIRSASGELLGYTLRFDDFSDGHRPCNLGRPLYVPLTCWQAADGNPCWRTKHLQGHMPLFRADQLVMHPKAPIILTQDERSAEYVDGHFIKGAEYPIGVGLVSAPAALEQTDLSPLAGRTVYIWPNSGPAGNAFAEQVQARLWQDNPMTRIAVISPVMHKPIQKHAETPFVIDQELDVVTDNWSPVHIVHWCLERRGRLELIVPKPCGKYADRKFDDFTVNDRGVFVERYKDGEPYQVQLSSRIDITALARNHENEEWGVCAEFQDPDGVRHVWCLPRGLLSGDSSTFCRPFLSMGATVSTAKCDKDDLGRYFMTGDPGGRARSVSKPGWCQQQFVFPDGTALGPSEERVVFQTNDPTNGNLYRRRGTLAEWQQHVATLCEGNSRLVLALCTALVGPALTLLGEESGGFHFRGESSSGKTTTLNLAASAWGPPQLNIKLWRATANGLESIASQRNDGLLILDEMSQASSHEVGQVAYLLANGHGKVRADQTGAARPSATWKLVFLSTGEVGLKEYIESGGGQVMAGQQTRLIDVSADACAGLGIFETLHGSASGAEFSQRIKTESANYYGTAARAWVTALADSAEQAAILAQLRSDIDMFASTFVPIGSDGQVVRVGRRFGLVAAVGEAGIRLGILPWSATQATGAAQKCFAGWIENRGGIGNLEADQALEQVRRFVETHGESRFTELGFLEDDVSSDHRMTINRAGFRKLAEDGLTDYFILPEAYKTQVCAGLDFKQVTQKLIAAGQLMRGSDGKSQINKRLPGMGLTRVYHVRSSILHSG